MTDQEQIREQAIRQALRELHRGHADTVEIIRDLTHKNPIHISPSLSLCRYSHCSQNQCRTPYCATQSLAGGENELTNVL